MNMISYQQNSYQTICVKQQLRHAFLQKYIKAESTKDTEKIENFSSSQLTTASLQNFI